jgi:lipopolysaccharide O-acetyltransferase
MQMSVIHSFAAPALAEVPGPHQAVEDHVLRLDGIRRSFVQRVFQRATGGVRAWWWSMRLGSFGPGSRIDRPAHVVGPHAIAIGRDVRIWRYARLEALDTHAESRTATAVSPPFRITIGDGTIIQPFVHVGAVEQVEIGRGVLMASRVYITDHDHDYSNPDDPVIGNRRVIASPVRIGDWAWLGEGVMVLKGVTIGQRSIIGAGSIVTRDVPPLSIAVGSPARVVRRFDPTSRTWERVA